jgi:hypothetical protein
LPTSVDDASNTVADGKVGTAYIQELRFNEYCKRLQSMIVETFDLEFKLWLNSQGINIDNSLFELKFNSPQNFAAYRQSELDTARAATFSQIVQIPHLSKRFAMKRFLGMTEEEIKENERMWREENGANLKTEQDSAGQMRSAGITPGGMAADLGTQDAEAPNDMAAAARTRSRRRRSSTSRSTSSVINKHMLLNEFFTLTKKTTTLLRIVDTMLVEIVLLLKRTINEKFV